MTTARRRLLLLSLLLVGATIVGWTQLRLRESSADPLQPSPFCASTAPKIACYVQYLFPGAGTVFALLKTTDNADKLDWGVRPQDSSAAELRDALRVLGAVPSHVRLVSPSAEPSLNTGCAIRPEWFGAAGKKRGIKTWINSHLPGTLGQLASWHQCFDMVEKAEASSGEQFDLVAKVRPDTLWFQGVMPWCSFFGDTDSVHTNAYWGDFLNKTGQGGGPASSAIVDYPPDQFFMLPRALAPTVPAPSNLYPIVPSSGAGKIPLRLIRRTLSRDCGTLNTVPNVAQVFVGLLDEYNACPAGHINAGYSIEEWAWGRAVPAAQRLGIALHRYPFPQVILRPNADAADVENKCARFVLPALPPTSATGKGVSWAAETPAMRLARCKEFLYQDFD